MFTNENNNWKGGTTFLKDANLFKGNERWVRVNGVWVKNEVKTPVTVEFQLGATTTNTFFYGRGLKPVLMHHFDANNNLLATYNVGSPTPDGVASGNVIAHRTGPSTLVIFDPVEGQVGNATRPYLQLQSAPSLVGISSISNKNWKISSLPSIQAGTPFTKLPTNLPPSVTILDSLLSNNTSFNQDISMWDVSRVTSFASTFTNAAAFNKPLAPWNMASALVVKNMFSGATSFSQDLSNWDLTRIQASNRVDFSKNSKLVNAQLPTGIRV